jgi:hypothetical protein
MLSCVFEVLRIHGEMLLESYQRVLEPMDEVVDEGEWVAILPGDGVQSSVVLDEAELSILLLDEEDRGSER